MFVLRRPPLLLTLAAAVLVALTLRLSVWQFDRAEQKRALEDAARAAMTATAVTMRALPSAPGGVAVFQRAALVGHYLPAQEILLDNRVRARRAGYHVVTPFVLEEGGAVMVNRGWLAGDGSRRVPPIPPPPAAQITVRGVFYTDEADAFKLSAAPETGRVRQNLHLRMLAEESGLPLLSLVLIKSAEDGAAAGEAGGESATLSAVTLRLDYKSAQSTSYAWQWLTFCALTIVFYLLLAFRK